MTAPSFAIPNEKQSDPQISRGCGAACLSMVYRSFGMDVPQAEELVGIKARLDRLAAATEESKQQQEVGRKKMEERNALRPPLAGNALGQALLKNLGFK